MGIVNVTPDSFSDGGRFFDKAAAVAHALKLISEGADIIDVGGESTRPRAAPVSEEEELRRVVPVIEELRPLVQLPISIDTMKPAVAAAAIKAGASIINDVAANREDGAMGRLVAETGAAYVVTHMRGTPQTMQNDPHYGDVVEEVDRFFESQIRRLEGLGVGREQIILDVGIGFGKTFDHNLQLLAGLERFKKYERPLLLGVSRKSFLDVVAGASSVSDRLPGSLACACLAVTSGAKIIRTHDVAATKQALRTVEAIIARKN